MPKFIGPDLEAPISGVSALVENLIYLRFVEKDMRLHRLLSLLKVRDVAYDIVPREFRIEAKGIIVEPSSDSARGLVSQAVRTAPRRR